MAIDYIVRELKKEDLKSSKGFLKTLENLSTVGTIDQKKAQDILDYINSKDGHIYVAIDAAEQIIGTATLLVEQKFIHAGGKVGHIEDVATREGYERKGVGKAVVGYAVEEAKKFGCYKVILDFNDENIQCYEKLGCKKYENCMRHNL